MNAFNQVLGLVADFVLHPGFCLVVVWRLVLVVLGLAVLPLTLALFKGFSDRGYLFSRLIGLLLTSYTVWLASSLKLAPFSESVAVLSVVAAALVNYAIPGSLKRVREFFREKRRVVVAEEYLFLAAFLAWAFLRSVKPDIDGIEKFMNLGFVNAALRAEWMPPVDMWLSGRPVNYYYFGHFVTAFLVRLTKIQPEIAYNLMISTIFSLAFSLSCSIVSNLLRRVDPRGVKKAVAGGLLAAFLLACGASLHPFVFGVALPALKKAGLYSWEVQNYWYPQARSFIGHHPPTDDKTISEFPFYSFVIADLHGHVLDTPSSLASIGIGASLLLSSSAVQPGTRSIRPPLAEALSGIILGTTWMTNAWNYPVHLLVLSGAALVLALKRHGCGARALAEAGLASLTLLLVSRLAALPYDLHFENMTKGVYRVMANSPLRQLAILWGYQLFFAACFAIFFYITARDTLKREANRTVTGGTLLSRTPPSDIVALGMFAAGLCLVAIPEIIYVKDIYGREYHRANTMFKMGYQAFVFFALASGYASVRIAGALRSRARRLSGGLLFALVAAMPLTYGYWAIPGFYAPLPSPGQYRRLDGLAFLPSGDRAIVEWFRGNVSGRQVILEADGESYTRSGRISMATGLPTLLGWHAHEWIWRGSPAEPDARRRDVRTLYESRDMEETRELAEKYGIRYIVIGATERERFHDIREAKLESMGRLVLTHPDGSKIVEVRPIAAEAERRRAGDEKEETTP
jgi:uncharacterized membrane protein